MPEHRKTISNSLSVGQEEAVARITPEVSAELQALDHAGRRTQQLTSRSLNARDEFVVFRPAVAGLLECAQPARRVRASSRRFWGRRPLIEKRYEDASHSQLRKLFARPHFPHTGGQAVQDAVDAFRPIHIRIISEPSCGNSETEGKAARVAASQRG
jgi:hypothetical protein